MRRAKIVCTLGPATATPELIQAMVEAGMDCARLNFSHGDHESHARTAQRVRDAASKLRKPVAILADLCGPKMRVGRFRGGKAKLERGATFIFTTDTVEGDDQRVSVTYKALPEDVRPGDAILLDDGLLRLSVDRVVGADVLCTVEVGGFLRDNKGLNLPGAQLSTPALTDKDRVDLAFAVDVLKVDYLALSFVRTAQDVHEAQELAKGTPVIAKIEKPEAIDNLSAIADVAAGMMVARGDLGVEMGSAKVPLIQKRIIREVNKRGKLVITATQMLDSMIRNPSPTRAEAADVANAVLDGTDALMLSGETASGSYPLESVRMMDAIVREVECSVLDEDGSQTVDLETQLLHDWGEWGFANAAARAAALLTFTLPLKVLVVFTENGRTASLLSEYRPRSPIVAITANPRAANKLALEWGVLPYVEIPPEDHSETLRIASALLVREKLCKSGDVFAMVVGWPTSSRPNTVKLHRL